MSNPVFKENFQGSMYLGSCAFAEPELLSYRKPNREAQNKTNGHKNPMIVTIVNNVTMAGFQSV